MPGLPGFVDIHSHLLPGIDDGPADLASSLEMARAAVAAGTGTLAATPHLRPDFPGVRLDEIAGRCEQIQSELDKAGIGLRVVAGAEVSVVWAIEASDEELRLATYGQRGKDLLLETPGDVSILNRLIHAIRARGPRVTLAHPERSRLFRSEPAKLAELSEQGVLLQINAETLLAPRRSGSRRLAEWLCREGLAHVVASDGHRAQEPRPIDALARATEPLAALVGKSRAHWMLAEAPAAILEGRPLPAAPELAPRRRLWPF